MKLWKIKIFISCIINLLPKYIGQNCTIGGKKVNAFQMTIWSYKVLTK